MDMREKGKFMHRAGVLLVACLALLAACSEADPRSVGQVEAAIAEHLARNSDLRSDSLRIKATHVRYEGETAVAQVSISASDDPKAVMTMVYELRQGPHGWRVESGAFEGRPGGTSPANPPSLPPGHPPVGGGSPH